MKLKRVKVSSKTNNKNKLNNNKDLDNNLEKALINSLINEDVANETEDSYSYKTESKNIANFLTSQKPPFVFAVIGKWGSGKSTFLNFLQKDISLASEDNILVYFNAFRASIHSDISAAFVIELKQQLEVFYSNKFSKIGRFFNKLLRLPLVNLLQKAWTLLKLPGLESFIVTTLMADLIKGYKKLKVDDYEKQIEAEKRIIKYFNKISQKLYDRKKNVYIIIDEIDRCSPKKAITIIESIRIFFLGQDQLEKNLVSNNLKKKSTDINIPFRYILSLDEESITASIAHEHNINKIEAFEYLTKFVQHKYYIELKGHTKFIQKIRDKYWMDRDWLNDGTIMHIDSILWIFKVKEPRKVRKILIFLYEWQKAFPMAPHKLVDLLHRKKAYQPNNEFTIIDALNIYWTIKACIRVAFPDEADWIIYYKLLERHFSYVRIGYDYKELVTFQQARETALQTKNNWSVTYNNKNASVPESELKTLNGEVRGRVEIFTHAFATSVEKLIKNIDKLTYNKININMESPRAIFDLLLYNPEEISK